MTAACPWKAIGFKDGKRHLRCSRCRGELFQHPEAHGVRGCMFKTVLKRRTGWIVDWGTALLLAVGISPEWFRRQRRKKAAAIPPPRGPGWHLASLLARLGVHADDSCDCLARIQQMEQWGVEGCIAHRAEIVEWLRTAAEERGWSAVIAAAIEAVKTGEAFTMNPLDPYGSLVDEAIRRASHAKEGQAA